MTRPTRWLDRPDAAPDGAIELLRHAKGAPGLSESVRAASGAVASKLASGVAVGSGAVGGSVAPKIGATLAAAAAKKVTVASLVLGVAAAGGYAVYRASSGLSGADRGAPSTERVPDRDGPDRRAELDRQDGVSGDSSSEQLPERVGLDSPRRAAVPTPGPTDELAQRPSAFPSSTVQRTAAGASGARPEPGAARTAAPRDTDPDRSATASAPAAETPSAVPVDALVLEAQLLEQARAALAAEPARALALAEDHAQRFSRGHLAVERELIGIEALRRLGRIDAARARIGVLVASPGASLYRDRIDKLRRALD